MESAGTIRLNLQGFVHCFQRMKSVFSISDTRGKRLTDLRLLQSKRRERGREKLKCSSAIMSIFFVVVFPDFLSLFSFPPSFLTSFFYFVFLFSYKGNLLKSSNEHSYFMHLENKEAMRCVLTVMDTNHSVKSWHLVLVLKHHLKPLLG